MKRDQSTKQAALLTKALDSIDQGILIYDENLIVIAFNQRVLEILDLPQDQFSIGGSFEDWVRFTAEHGGYGAKGPVEERVQRRMAIARLFEPYQTDQTRFDDRVVEIRGKPIPGGGYVTTYTDVTERVRTEQALIDTTQLLETQVQELSDSQEIMQAFADNIPEYISFKDPNGRFIFVNKRFEEWSDMERSEILGKTVREIYPPERAAEIFALDRKVMSDRSVFTRELALVYPDGNKRDVISKRFPVQSADEDVIGLGIVNVDITDLKRAEREVAEKERMLRTALDNMTDGIYVCDDELNFVLFNDRYMELVNLGPDVIRVGAPVEGAIRAIAERGGFGDIDFEAAVASRLSELANGQTLQSEEILDGGGRVVEFRKTSINGGGAVVIATDITARRRNENAVRESEARASAILNTSSQLQGLLNPDGTLIEVNAAALSMINASAQDVAGKPFWNCPWWTHNPNLQIRLEEAVTQGAQGETVQFLATHSAPDGSVQSIDFRITPVRDQNGDVVLLVPEGHDVTALKDREEQLETQTADLVALTEELEAAKQEMQYLANHDALTGLPSLRLCRDRLENALAIDRRNKTQTAVLFIDLDGFKAVNDSMGHEAGDEVLKGVAKRLKSSVREMDTAARVGGDEFILVLPNTGDRGDIAKIAQNLIDNLSEPFPVDGARARIGASIGIAISPTDGATSYDLLRHADESMYAIKKQGKNNFGFFA